MLKENKQNISILEISKIISLTFESEYFQLENKLLILPLSGFNPYSVDSLSHSIVHHTFIAISSFLFQSYEI